LITISHADRFQPFRPRHKMSSAREFFADDCDLAPKVRNDVVIGSVIQVLKVDRAADR
jgi:hypothetical protein